MPNKVRQLGKGILGVFCGETQILSLDIRAVVCVYRVGAGQTLLFLTGCPVPIALDLGAENHELLCRFHVDASANPSRLGFL